MRLTAASPLRCLLQARDYSGEFLTVVPGNHAKSGALSESLDLCGNVLLCGRDLNDPEQQGDFGNLAESGRLVLVGFVRLQKNHLLRKGRARRYRKNKLFA
jgi:hypothetical protein